MATIGTAINGMRITSINPGRVILTHAARELQVSIPTIVRIPGGTFIMGSNKYCKEQPVRSITLTEYGIGKYPVTNGEYLGYSLFLKYTKGIEVPALVAEPKNALHPVINISWVDATGYCKFLMDITGRKFGLLTEARWEFAARGTEGREYPWGNDWNKRRVAYNTSGTRPIKDAQGKDTYSEGASPLGVMHMSGNVWEWCADWYGIYSGNNMTDPNGPESGRCRVLRGGAWCCNSRLYMRSANRDSDLPVTRLAGVGFRVSEG